MNYDARTHELKLLFSKLVKSRPAFRRVFVEHTVVIGFSRCNFERCVQVEPNVSPPVFCPTCIVGPVQTHKINLQ